MYPNLSSDELAYAIRRYDGGRFSRAWITYSLDHCNYCYFT
jgi:hypothetical protein